VAAFVLQIFHKLEEKVNNGSLNIPCFWFRQEKEPLVSCVMKSLVDISLCSVGLWNNRCNLYRKQIITKQEVK